MAGEKFNPASFIISGKLTKHLITSFSSFKIEEGRLDDVFREITVADTKIDKEPKATKEEQ